MSLFLKVFLETLIKLLFKLFHKHLEPDPKRMQYVVCQGGEAHMSYLRGWGPYVVWTSPIWELRHNIWLTLIYLKSSFLPKMFLLLCNSMQMSNSNYYICFISCCFIINFTTTIILLLIYNLLYVFLMKYICIYLSIYLFTYNI